MLVGPVDGERAAIGEDEDHWLAGGRYSFKQIFFWLGKIDAGAVAAFEARHTHLHLFAFEFAGNAENSDDDVSILCCLHCFGLAILPRRVINPESGGLTSLEMHGSESRLGGITLIG